MDDGIGRTGYRLLAFLFTAIGFLGLGALWVGVQSGPQVITAAGFAMAGLAYLTLWGLTTVTPNTPRAGRSRKARRKPSRRRDQGPEPRPESDVPDFEFDDVRPAAPAAPEEMVLPGAFGEPDRPGPQAAASATAPPQGPLAFQERDPAAWPGAKDRGGQSTWTAEKKAKQAARQRAERKGDPSRFADKYTRNTPVVRDILHKPKTEKRPVPPDGKTRGQCGQCGTVLLAPAKRPLRLKCPGCSKVTLLKE